MFRLPKNYSVSQEVQKVEANYTIQKNDLLQLEVFTNRGEKILDPSLEALQATQTNAETPIRSFLVTSEGNVKFPLIDAFKAEGLTLRQAEELLQKEYAKYYLEPFVTLNYSNKRVVVLGALGGQVIPLTNENMKLTEVLALAKGINTDGKATNIRILRGESVFVADLSTIAGYQQYNMLMKPNDIIYIEPVRRPVIEIIRDYGPILGVATSVTTLVVLIISLNSSN
jgi:polysaccharide export outer membrane protein